MDAVRLLDGDILLNTEVWGVWFPYDGFLQVCLDRQDAETNLKYIEGNLDPQTAKGATLVQVYVKEVGVSPVSS